MNNNKANSARIIKIGFELTMYTSSTIVKILNLVNGLRIPQIIKKKDE